MVVGLRSTASNWNPDLLQTLAAERQVIIFDNRGNRPITVSGLSWISVLKSLIKL